MGREWASPPGANRPRGQPGREARHGERRDGIPASRLRPLIPPAPAHGGARGLITWAETPGQTEVAHLLEQSLDEEKTADELLTHLAEEGVNALAARGDGTD